MNSVGWGVRCKSEAQPNRVKPNFWRFLLQKTRIIDIKVNWWNRCPWFSWCIWVHWYTTGSKISFATYQLILLFWDEFCCHKFASPISNGKCVDMWSLESQHEVASDRWGRKLRSVATPPDSGILVYHTYWGHGKPCFSMTCSSLMLLLSSLKRWSKWEWPGEKKTAMITQPHTINSSTKPQK